MSWDFEFLRRCDCGHLVAEDAVPDGVTWNLAPMYEAAIESPRGINIIQGVRGDRGATILHLAIERMEADPDKFKQFNPPNGWGEYDGALRVLKELYQLGRDNPYGIYLVK